MLTALLSLLPILQLVAGHGYVQDITLGSTEYTGYLPYSDPYVLLLQWWPCRLIFNSPATLIPFQNASFDRSPGTVSIFRVSCLLPSLINVVKVLSPMSR